MSDPMWNDEQAEETLNLFRAATPRIQADEKFQCGVYLAPNGVYVPVVCLREDILDDSSVLNRYVAALKQGDEFKIVMKGMVILVGIGIPTTHLPHPVKKEELDEKIIYVWEQWFKLNPRADAF